MAYNVQGLNKNKPGETAEYSENGSPEAGLYQHPQAIDQETGKLAEMITLYDPLFGNTQSEAAVRLGFVRIGDAPEGSIHNIIEQNKNERTFNSNTVESDKARLDALELESLRSFKSNVLAEQNKVIAEPKTIEEVVEVTAKKESK